MDAPRIRYQELVDVSKLQALMESFHQAIGVANAVIDVDGVVIAHAGWQEVCTRFHRVHPETCRRCIESDTSLVEKMTRGAPYAVYNCLNGLVDSAAPIMVCGQHVANVFTGQFLTASPDIGFYLRQAREFGFDEQDYLAAVSRVPVIAQEKVEAITQLYARLAETLAENGMDRLRQQQASEELNRVNNELELRVQKRTAELMRTTESLATAQRIAHIGNWELDIPNNRLVWSDEIYRIFEIDKTRFSANYDAFLAAIHPEDRAAVSAAYSQSLASRTPYDITHRLLMPDGRVKYVHEQCESRFDVDGRPIRSIGTVQDITDRKQVEDLLLESELRLRTILDSVDACIYLKDVDGRYLFANQAVLDLWQVRRQDVVGQTDEQFFDAATVRQIRQNDRQVLGQGCVLRKDEINHVPVSGETHVYQSTKLPLFNADGSIHALCGISVDITERKRTEIELDNYRRRLEVMVAERTDELEASNKQLSDTQFAMDRVGIGIGWNDAVSGRFLYVNDQVCRQLGYLREELLDLAVSDINPEISPDRLVEIANDMRQSGNSLRFETTHRRKDGTTFPVEVVAYLKRMPGGDVFIAFYNDISVRKETEAALIAAREVADNANRAKSTFLANMSHELRTPLNGIMGMTELALRHTKDPVVHDFLTKASLSSQHLLSVINDILDISKIEADRLKLDAIDFTINQVLANLVSQLHQKALDKGLEWLIQLPPGLPGRHFTGDPVRLAQVLLNLVGNAIKFTSRGSVTLRARIQEANPDGLLLYWEVSDTGIGIDVETQKRLFNAFEQADSSMTRKYGGTGLGLAICRRLVTLMGGDIGVASTLGQGSTFWFTVRLRMAAEVANPFAPVPSENVSEREIKARYRGERVLLAEDEPVSLEITHMLLKEVGFAVDLAEDGSQALQLARQNRYALVLLDMQMPILNGVEAARAIRADSLNQSTPILAMTANAFEEDREACFAAGMDDHVAKPVEAPEFYRLMLKWLDSRGR